MRDAPARGRYFVLETISTAYRVAAWVTATAMVVAGAVLLINATDQQKIYSITGAIACFVWAAVGWLTCMVVAEGIALFVDVAYDVRSILAKMTE